MDNKKSCSDEQLVNELEIKLKVASFVNYFLSIVVGALIAILLH